MTDTTELTQPDETVEDAVVVEEPPSPYDLPGSCS